MKLTTEQIQRAYVACFGRNADLGGLEYWKENDFESEYQMYQMFVASEEGQGIYANKSIEETIKTIYNNALNRDAEPTGLEAWINHYNTVYNADINNIGNLIFDITFTAIGNKEQTQALVNAAETLTKTEQIELAFITALERPASNAELNSYLIQDKSTLEYINDLALTDEFQNNGKTLIELVQNKINLIGGTPTTDINQMVNDLVLATGNPLVPGNAALLNQMTVATSTTANLLFNSDKLYVNLASPEGLAKIKEILNSIDANFDPMTLPNIIKEITGNNEIDPNAPPTVDTTQTSSPALDINNNWTYDTGDNIMISFSKEVQVDKITLDNIVNKEILGDNAKIVPINPEGNLAKSYIIVLGDNATVQTDSEIILDKTQVLDSNNTAATENLVFKVGKLSTPTNYTPPQQEDPQQEDPQQEQPQQEDPQQEQPQQEDPQQEQQPDPITTLQVQLKGNDVNQNGKYDENDTLNIHLDLPVKTDNITLDKIPNSEKFGVGAKIEAEPLSGPQTSATDGMATDFIITLGTDADLTAGEQFTVSNIDNSNIDLVFTVGSLSENIV